MISVCYPAFEAASNGSTLWINGADGACIGRFTARHVEIHRGFAAQMAGEGECLDCFDRTDDFEADWARFVHGMVMFHNVIVPLRAKRWIDLGPAGMARKR